MNSIHSLVYVGHGNIPSRWAHVVQMIQMSQAFAQIGMDVELLTQTSLQDRVLQLLHKGHQTLPEMPDVRLVQLVTTVRSNLDGDGFFQGLHFPRFDSRAFSYILRRKPDVVFTRSRRVAVTLLEAGVPTVVECHNQPRSDSQRCDVRRVIAQNANPAFLGLVTISEPLKNDYVRAGMSADRVIVLPDAVDLASFEAARNAKSQSQAPAQARSNSATERCAFRVGYCGQLYEWKGIGVLLQAAHALPQFDFEIIGGNPEDLEHWRLQSRDLGNVTFRGYVPHAQVPTLLQDFDVVCMPNLAGRTDEHTMSPLKMYEYMASERAIVASSLSSICRVLQHERNALLCAPGSADELVAALKRLHEDEPLRKALAARARADVQTVTWQARAQILKAWMEDALATRTVTQVIPQAAQA